MNREKRYSPKETLAYLSIANQNSIVCEIGTLMSALEWAMDNIEQKDIMDMINMKVVSKVKNYWILKKSQVMAYGYIVFNHLLLSENKITDSMLLKDFIAQMRIYSPDNAVDFVKRYCRVDLDAYDR